MIWTSVSWLWRSLGQLRWPIVWILSPKYTLGVNALIVNADGKVWVQQHRFWPDHDWGLPGGIVSANESPEAALQREIREELGLMAYDIKIFSTELFYRRGVSLCFTARVRDGEVRIDSKELLDAGYRGIDELPERLLPSHRKLIHEFFSAEEHNERKD